MSSFYSQYLESLCRRRGWDDPSYECHQDHKGFTCLVLVNGDKYETDLAYESDVLARENAAMRAFVACRNFSSNGGMQARDGIGQGLPATEPKRRHESRYESRYPSSSDSVHRHSRSSDHHSSGSKLRPTAQSPALSSTISPTTSPVPLSEKQAPDL